MCGHGAVCGWQACEVRVLQRRGDVWIVRDGRGTCDGVLAGTAAVLEGGGGAVEDGVSSEGTELALLLRGFPPASGEEEVGFADFMRMLVVVWRYLSESHPRRKKDSLTARSDLISVIEGLVANRRGTPLSLNLPSIRAGSLRRQGQRAAHLPARQLPLPLRKLLDVFLPAAPSMPRAHEFGVILEAWWDGLAAVGVALDKLDNFSFLLARAPGLELLQVRKNECIPIVWFARAVCRLWGRRDRRGRGGGSCVIHVLRVRSSR